MTEHRCRFCDSHLQTVFADLGYTPLANAYQREPGPQTFYPLIVYTCDQCLLVQLPEWADPETIFTDYAYFASQNPVTVRHAKGYADMMIERFKLTHQSRVVEVASNDGYLLQHFQMQGIKVLGVEPAANVAEYARDRHIPTVARFFGTPFVREYHMQADLIVANNVLAHVPDLNDFVAALALAVKPTGVITVEVPWLLAMLRAGTFDLIYHEHFSYFSLGTLFRIFAQHGLRIVDVERLTTHGGSIRLFIKPHESGDTVGARVTEMIREEAAAMLDRLETYRAFAERIRMRRQGEGTVYFGAPAKLTTRLHALGEVGTVEYVVDDSPVKQGKFLPGTTIPIYAPHRIMETKPSEVVIAAWNLEEVITERLRGLGYMGKISVAL